MVVELSHEVVVSFMRWLFREATTLSLSLLSLLHIIKNSMWHCMGRPMGLLTCTNVLALSTLSCTTSKELECAYFHDFWCMVKLLVHQPLLIVQTNTTN
jgi:hypothetical protein